MFSEKIYDKVGKKFNLRQKAGLFGIEIETEGENLPAGPVTKEFQGKADGSLRDGMEYISTVLQPKDVFLAVENLNWTLGKRKAVLKPTYRSSTHIHVNYIDSTFKDVLGTLVLWALVEPAAFRMIPPGRDGSLFCVSSYDSGELAEFVAWFCEDISRDFPHGFRPRGKYSSLNVTRLGPGHDAPLGTLEYRIFPSSVDGRQIQTWCKWLENIQNVVAKEEDPSFLTMVRNAEQNPKQFLASIFEETPFIGDQSAQLVDFGARTAFEMARVISKKLKEKPRERKAEKAIPVELGQAEVGPAAPVGFPRRRARAVRAADANRVGAEAPRVENEAERRRINFNRFFIDDILPNGEIEL